MGAIAEFKVIGKEGFDKAIDHWVERTAVATRGAVEEAAKVIQAEAAPHIASKSGWLAGEWSTEIEAAGFGAYTARTGPTSIYARIHELGKRKPHNRGPHPFFAPGFTSASSKFGEIYAKAWREAARG